MFPRENAVVARQVLVVEHGDVRRCRRSRLPATVAWRRLTPRLCARRVQQFVSGLLDFLRRRADRRGVPTSNSMLTCGTGRPAGHRGVPKHASAAWDNGQMPNDLQPAIRSLSQ